MRFWILSFWLPLAALAAEIPGRYIVELDDAPAAVRLAGRQRRLVADEEMGAHRAGVRAGQKSVRAAIEAVGGEVLEAVDTVANAVVVRIPDADARRLASLAGVRRVRPERSFKLLLDRAVVVDRIVDAWTVVGVDRAGLGVKIAIIDTGIDPTHAGFQDPSLPVPPGFPKVNADSDRNFANSKVIVARSYATLFASGDPDPSARDRVGHGTGTAMAAAGVRNAGPKAVIQGVAPKAYLGNYKVFGSPGVNDNATESAILKAIDDAVADGMDVINLSLGGDLAGPVNDDPEDVAIQRAAGMGVVVVVAAGNAGPDPHTIGSPASSPFAISVGATSNDRVFSGSATVGTTRYLAIPGSGPAPAAAVTAPLIDVAALQSDGLACAPFSAGSLAGRIALILRGTCFFSDKLANAAAAGAVGALVYTDAGRPDAISMEAGSATLPATMVGYQDGLAIKHRLAADPSLSATLDFIIGPVFIDPNRMAGFSSRGPNVDGAIKPDLVAVGTSFYTATHDPSGYVVTQGTSFSAPLVAGAAALLRAARPGLSSAQYRSLLINTAAPAYLSPGMPARVQVAGAGSLDLTAALAANSTVSPASLAFGIGPGNALVTRSFTLTNIGSTAETFSLSAVSQDGLPGFVPAGSRTATAFTLSLSTPGRRPVVTLSPSAVKLAPGASAPVTVNFLAAGLGPGEHEGVILIAGAGSGIETRVPYWYGTPATLPQHLTVLESESSGLAGTVVANALLFRLTDAAGITGGFTPHATVVSGGGTVLSVMSLEPAYPGVFSVAVRLGPLPGVNLFRIQAGALTQDVTILGN